MDVPAALSAAANSALNDLWRTSFTLPVDEANLRAKAGISAEAELKLAHARADAIAKIQNSPDALNAEQLAFVSGGGGGLNAPGGTMAYDDYSGFVKIFDGATLSGWNGEADVWSVEEGAIHSNNTPGHTTGQHHIHYVGPGYLVKDFDLKVEMKMTQGANGGIQYRSRLLAPAHGPGRSISDPATIADPLGKPLPPGVTNLASATAAGITGGNPWQVSGYQFDMDSGNGYTGQLYEGQGRSIVTGPGEMVQLFPSGLRFVLGRVAEPASQYVKPLGEWNQIEIIARGNTLIHMMNGHVMSITVDDDPVRHALQGIISLQLEAGGQIWYRNVWLKHL